MNIEFKTTDDVIIELTEGGSSRSVSEALRLQHGGLQKQNNMVTPSSNAVIIITEPLLPA